MSHKQTEAKGAADPRFHTQQAQERLDVLIHELRDGVGAVDDLQAQALFETAAEVLGGLKQAFAHYESKREQAWED